MRDQRCSAKRWNGLRIVAYSKRALFTTWTLRAPASKESVSLDYKSEDYGICCRPLRWKLMFARGAAGAKKGFPTADLR
jgi:hypothetical protein